MPIDDVQRAKLYDCRAQRFAAEDAFSDLRLEPDMASYLAFADAALEGHWPCPGCGRRPNAEHPPWPVHRLHPCWGGSDAPDNLLACCSRCMRRFQQQVEVLMLRWAEARALRTSRGMSGLPPVPHRSFADLVQRLK